MLNISFLARIKVELYDLTVCIVSGKWRKISMSHSDLDLGGTKPNIELENFVTYFMS